MDVSISVPLSWAKKYPGEMQRDEFGRVYRDVSLASGRYHRDFSRYLRHVVGACERQPWGDRIVGYQLLNLLGEGLMQLAIAGRMFDVSPASQQAFRNWVRSRYGSAARLRRAWGNPRLTFKGVRVPTEKAWHRKKAIAAPTFGGRPIPVPVSGPTRELPANLTYGDGLAYGPTLLPGEGAVERAGAVALGRAVACFFMDRDGLFLKEFGRGARGNRRPGPRGPNDYAVAWSAALPLPAELLRSLVRHAGGHVWCEENDVVYASENLAAIHTSKAGPRTLKLPRPCAVRDALTGQVLGRRLREIRLKLRSPDTRLFELTSAR